MSSPSSLPGAGKVATVTGGTGFVGGELVRQLLLRGYAVRAVTRGGGNPAALRAAPLTRLAQKLPHGAASRLALHPVPTLERRSPELDAAVRGAHYVFHVASPFRFDGDAEADVLRPAVEGTRAVLGACAAAGEGEGGRKPRRVVVTSSVCAIHDMKATQPRRRAPDPTSAEATDPLAATKAGIQYDEGDWNEKSAFPEEAYWVSKVRAEREAFECAAKYGLDIATILPNFVLGPIALEGGKESAAGSVSVGFMKKFVEATPESPPPAGFWTVCDVRDVAEAHWRAAEADDDKAKGQRFIVSQPRTIDGRFVTDALKKKFPAAAGKAGLPDGASAGEAGDIRAVDATKVATVLGLEYTDPADTVADMAASLLEKGVAEAAWFEKKGEAKELEPASARVGGGGGGAAAAAE